MARPYLFGPVTPDFAEQHLDRARASGSCRTFHATEPADLTLRLQDSWEDVCRQFPADGPPGYVVLYLPYTTIPHCLWSAPVPVIGLALDWNLLWHGYRNQLGSCDLILTDTAGVEVCRRHGLTQARFANLFGCERVYLETPWPD